MCDIATVVLTSRFKLLSFFTLIPYIGHQTASALHRIGFNMQCQTTDVAENLGMYLSFTECTFKGKDFELILMVKMETRHPVEDYFGSEFRKSVIIVEL